MPTLEQTVIQRIKRLIASPSVSSTNPHWDSSNLDVIQHLADFAEAQGFAVDIQPLPGNPDKANLVARLGPESPSNQRRGLVLSGHTDTVPFDAERWRSDPLQATEYDGALYGLGSADMKSFFALALAAADSFNAKALSAPLYLVATCDEESTMAGARHLVAETFAGARAAIIGEPTSLQPVRMHKGIMMQAITVKGRSGHSSNPALGNNALDALPVLLNLLSEYRLNLAQRFRCELLPVASPTLNFGCIHGGDNPNRICGEVELHFDVRLVPGLDFNAVEAELQHFVEQLAKDRELDVEMRRLIEPVPAFEQPISADLVALTESLSGHDAMGVNYATEAPFLQQLGLETIVLGPGSIDTAHKADEHLPLNQLKPAIKLLQSAIANYCTSH